MTIQEYKARNVEISSQIDRLTATRASYARSEADWRRQSLEPCNQTLSSRRQACVADKQMKKQMADSNAALIREADAKLHLLKNEFTQNLKSINDYNVRAQTLAEKGLDINMLEAEAQAAIVKAEGEAAAQQTLAASEANTNEKAAATKRAIIILIVGLMLFIALIVAIKKLRNSKKSKK